MVQMSKELQVSYLFNQHMLSLSVPFGGPSCTVHTTDITVGTTNIF